MPIGLRVRGAALVVILGLGGCTTFRHLFDPDRVDRADQAGSVHVAVLAVAPWDKVKEDLQPKFDLTPAQAYDQAIPVTQQLIERVLDALSASLKVALPTHTVTQSSTRTDTTGQASTETATRTDERRPGDPSKVQSGMSPSGSVPAPFSPPPAMDGRAVDPMLRYQAATALYQEVKILNQYVANAMKREGYTPYLLRLQISVLPNKRNLPYDTYANIAFYSARERLHRSVALSTLHGGSRLMGPTSLFATESEPGFRGTGQASGRTLVMQHPVVIPLLVTDNLESLLHESAVQTVRQSALGLLAVLKGVGIGGNVDSLQNELQAVLGKDLNSLLTVARMSDNTVRVRLGAMNQPQSGSAMIPRTHNISLMLLIPDQASHVKVMTEADFRDVESGELLKHRDPQELRAAIKAVWHKYRLPPLKTEEHYNKMANAIYFNDFAGFSEIMTEIENQIREDEQGRNEGLLVALKRVFVKDERSAPTYPFSSLNLFSYLWVDLVGTRTGSSFSQASFDVPRASTAAALSTCPAVGQTPVLLDDGSSTTAVLHGGKDLDPSKLLASLTTKCGSDDYQFAPEQVAAAEGKTLRFSFSSLKAVLPPECAASKSRPHALVIRNCTWSASVSPIAALQKNLHKTKSVYADLEDFFQDFLDRQKKLGEPAEMQQIVAEVKKIAAFPQSSQTPPRDFDKFKFAIAQIQIRAPDEFGMFAHGLRQSVVGIEKAAPATKPDSWDQATWDQLNSKLPKVQTGAQTALTKVGTIEQAIPSLNGTDYVTFADALKGFGEALAELASAVDAVASTGRERPAQFTARYTEKSTPVATPLTVSAGQVVATEAGDGKLVVTLEKLPEKETKVLLRVSGGEVVTLEPATVQKKGGAWIVGSAPIDLALTLRNLSSVTDVNIWTTTEQGAPIGKPIQLKVVQPAKKEPR